jgi:hypothetical protein
LVAGEQVGMSLFSKVVYLMMFDSKGPDDA